MPCVLETLAEQPNPERTPLSELVSLAWPIVISLLSYSLMTIVDTLFVSRLGPAALAGVGLGGTLAFILLCFPSGILRAVKALTAQAIGAGRREERHAYLAAGLLAAAGFGVLVTAAGWLLCEPLSRIAATPQAAQHARGYLGIRLLGTLPVLGLFTLQELRYALGDAQLPMRAAVIANAFHILLAYLLVVLLGRGVEGAAWATVVSQSLEAGLLIATQARDGFEPRRMRLFHVRALWSMGWPIAVQFVLEVGSFALLSAMLASWSERDMAAHQIAIQVAHVAFLPAFAIGEAVSVLVARAVGAGRPELVPALARTALGLACAYTLGCTVVFAVAAGPLARLFTSDPMLAHLAEQLLHVACLFLVVDAANVVARGTLRGTGDVRVPAAVGIITAWVMTPPLTYLLGRVLGWGALGAWSGLCAEIVLGAAILWWRLGKESWRPAANRAYESARMQPAIST
jgi:MATE family multidrug resistance protein